LAETLGLSTGDSYLSLSHLSSSWTLQEFLACMLSGAALSLMDWSPGSRALENTARRLSPSFVRMSHAAFMEMFNPYFRPGPLAARHYGPARRLKAAAARFWAGHERVLPEGPRSFLRRVLIRRLFLGGRAPKILLSCGTLSQRAFGVMKSLGQPVLNTYGLTEGCGFLTVNRAGTESHGRLIAGMKLRVGSDGELLVSGPAMMNGYMGALPGDADQRCKIEGGELCTRDFGRLDADGEFHYESSARYRIVRGEGLPVPCDRIETLLMREPLITRATVITAGRGKLKSAIALIDPDLDALDRFFGPRQGRGESLERWEQEHLKACLRSRLGAIAPELHPKAFIFSASGSNASWAGKLCPDRRPLRLAINARDNFDLLYIRLRKSPKPAPPDGVPSGNKGEPIFLSVESEFDRPLMRHEDSRRDFGFKMDKVLGGGIASLLGTLEQAGWDPDYLPYRFRWHMGVELQVRKLVQFLAQRPGRIITAGCASVSLPFLLSALKEVRRLDPSRKVVLGGCGPSAAAGAIMAHCPFVDAVVMGEAEASLPKVLEALSSGGDLSRIPGVTTRAPDGMVVDGVPERIRDLDALPLPSYGRIDLRLYHHVSVPTMRGCPNQCKFCGNRAMYGPGVSLRSLDRVMDELRLLHYKYGQNDFFISDDTFTLIKPRVLEFCSKMRSEFGRRVNWFCYASVDSLDAERMRAMSGAGCRSVFIGVESGSDRLLRRYKGAGHYTVEEAVAKMAEASRYFASVQAGLIVGFPDESLSDFFRTLRVGRLLMRRGYGDLVLHWLKAIPLTPLFEQNRKTMIIPPAVKLYMGTSQYSQWAAGMARLDPGLAPWSVQLPTPYARLKSLLLWRFMRGHWDLL
jgi:hypothetical protein